MTTIMPDLYSQVSFPSLYSIRGILVAMSLPVVGSLNLTSPPHVSESNLSIGY